MISIRIRIKRQEIRKKVKVKSNYTQTNTSNKGGENVHSSAKMNKSIKSSKNMKNTKCNDNEEMDLHEMGCEWITIETIIFVSCAIDNMIFPSIAYIKLINT